MKDFVVEHWKAIAMVIGAIFVLNIAYSMGYQDGAQQVLDLMVVTS